MTSKPSLGAGDVEVFLAGQTRVMKPTITAIRSISKYAGGIRPASMKIYQMDFDAFCAVIKAGLDLTDHGADGLDDMIYEAGLPGLLKPCSNYLINLQKGGRPPSPEEVEDADENPTIT